MSLLAASCALFHLHRTRGPLRLAIQFYNQRHRQLRRAIRRQQFVVLILLARVCLRPGRPIVIPQAREAVYLQDQHGDIKIRAVGAIPKCIAIKLRKPELFSLLTVHREQWIVIASHRFLFWNVVELNKKLT